MDEGADPSAARARPPAAHEIARWSAGLQARDLPEDVAGCAKALMLDAVGVALAATGDEASRSLARWAARGPSGVVSAITMQDGLPAEVAATVNGAMIHALDFDEIGFGGHPTACVMPAVMACAEEVKADGSDVLAAYVAGVELFGRLALHTDVMSIHAFGWHPTSVWGCLAATIGAARARGLPADITASALAIAASSAGGLAANLGSMMKPLQVGLAAATGVRSCHLAECGVKANGRILEEPEGFGAAYARDQVRWDDIVLSLGRPFRLGTEGPDLKRWPCCGGLHRAIAALMKIVLEGDLKAAGIESVTVHIHPLLLKVARYGWPNDRYEARFSMSFCLALVAAHGAIGEASFTPSNIDDPRLRRIGERIEVVADLAAGRGDARVAVTTRDGRRLCEQLDARPTAAPAAIGDASFMQRWRDHSAGAGLAEDSLARLAQCFADLERCSAQQLWPAWAGLRSAGTKAA